MKKGIVVAILAGAIVLGPTPASALSLGELLGRIRELLTQVQTLEKQVEEAQTTQNASTATKATKVSPANGNSSVSSSNSKDGFCYNWEKNLRIGDKGSDIGYLHRVLEMEGFAIPDGEGPQKDGETLADSRFGEPTASAVVGFQEKYASEILTPNGLTRGNGYVGASTRAVLNRLYGCAAGQSEETVTITSRIASHEENGTIVDYSVSYNQDKIDPIYMALELFCPKGVEASVPGEDVPRCNKSMKMTPGETGYRTRLLFTNANPTAQTIGATAKANGLSGHTSKDALTIPGAQPEQPSIKVVSPNGGEAYKKDEAMEVKWKSEGGDKVSIYLGYPDGGTCYIDTVKAEKYSYSFVPYGYKCPNIPQTIGSGQYRVNLYLDAGKDSDIGVARDKSDTFFTVGSGVQNTPSSIKVLSPNGGEVLKVGSTHNIKWTSTNVPLDDGGTLSVQNIVTGETPLNRDIAVNGGSLSNYGGYIPWVVTGSAGQYRATICSKTLSNPTVTFKPLCDSSDNYFTVNSGVLGDEKPMPWIAITTPNEVVNKDGTQKIVVKWDDFNGDFDFYQVYFGNSTAQVEKVVSGEIRKSSNSFTITTDQVREFDGGRLSSETGNYFRVMALVKDRVGSRVVATGKSAEFKILNANTATPSIKVLSPNGGEVYTVDQPIVVGFMNSGGKRTFFNLVDSKNAGFDLISYNNYYYKNVSDPYYPATGGGLYDSTTKLYLPKDWVRDHGTKYKIEVCSENKCDKSDTYFTITSAYPTSTPTPTPTPNITRPTATIDQSSLSSSSNHPRITGTAHGVNAVGLSIGKNGGKFDGTGTFKMDQYGNWGVTLSNQTYEPGTYQVDVYSDTNVLLISGTLTVIGNTTLPPSVTLLSPNGGQTLKKGETITVTWSSRNMTSAEYIYLDIFKGNPQTGSSRVYRSALTTNDGQETLTIPTTLTAGADYYIHVTAAKGYFDASDSQIFITDSTGQFGLIPASKAYLSAAFETSSEDRAGAWDAFSGGRARLHSGSADWKWAITLDLLAQKTIQSITVLHKNENGEVWSTSADAGLTGVKPYPLVVLRGASQVNSAYDQTLGTFNTGSYTFTLYGQKESEITGTVKISVKFTDNTSVTKEVAAPTTTTTPTPTATPTLTPTPTPTPTR